MEKNVIDETILFILMQYKQMNIVKEYVIPEDEMVCNACNGQPVDSQWRKLIIHVPNVAKAKQEFCFCSDECTDVIRGNPEAAMTIVMNTLETMELLILANAHEAKKKPNRELMTMIDKAKKKYGKVEDPAGLIDMAMKMAKDGESKFKLQNLKK